MTAIDEVLSYLDSARMELYETWKLLEECTECAVKIADEMDKQGKSHITWDELEEICKVFEDDQEEDPEQEAMAKWISEQGPTF